MKRYKKNEDMGKNEENDALNENGHTLRTTCSAF